MEENQFDIITDWPCSTTSTAQASTADVNIDEFKNNDYAPATLPEPNDSSTASYNCSQESISSANSAESLGHEDNSDDILNILLTPALRFEKAEAFKACGNLEVQQNSYLNGSYFYTKAIDLYADLSELSDSNNLHIYYTNRSLCHLKLENYGLAIMDSQKAIELKPTYSKAYYRRGCAYVSLGQFENALTDFREACKIQDDPDTRRRIKDCRREVRHSKFAKAISSERTKPVSETVKLSKIEASADESSYTGPRYRRSESFLPELLKFLEKPGNVLLKGDMYRMVLDMIQELKTLPTLVDIKVEPGEEFTICGDIHGQYYDLLNIFDINGYPSEQNPYLFNGDFVDRGSFSVECIGALFAAKLIYPQHVHLARGNHETRNMNELYGFQGEVEAKYDKTLYELFCECFNWLPLAHTINGRIFIVHGGLFSRDNVKLSDIMQINRNTEPGDDGLMTELLWSDPQPSQGRNPSKRGVACAFGPDVTQAFLQENNLDYIIRSHEMKPDGYSEEHYGKLITVFSAPNYCDTMGNKGAFIRLNGSTLKPEYTQFDAVPHPPVRPMQYAKPLFI